MLRRCVTLFLASITFLSTSVVANAVDPSPNVPTGVKVKSESVTNAALDQAKISVGWTPSVVDGSHPAPNAYVVTATATGEPTGTTTIPCSPCSGSTIDAIVEGLSGGVSYNVVVTAKKDAAENSAPSVSFVTHSIPGAPGATSATAGVRKVTLNWTAPTNSGGTAILRYKISATGIALRADATASSLEINSLQNATAYDFSISAVNATGESALANFTTATTPGVPDAPISPQTEIATSAATTIKVSWAAPTRDGGSAITSYTAYLIDSTGADYKSATTTTGTATSVEIPNIKAGSYTAKIIATNGAGDSSRSVTSNSTTVDAAALVKNDPTISFSTTGDVQIDSVVTVSATTPSGESPTFTVQGSPTGACTISGTRVTAVLEGVCTVKAKTVGDTTYDSGSASKNFSIIKKSQIITFPDISTQTYPGTLALIGTSTSGLGLAFAAIGNCTVSSSIVTFTSAGTCGVTASQAGDTKYRSALSVRRDFTINAIVSGGGAPPAPAPTPSVIKVKVFFKIVDPVDNVAPVGEKACVEMYLVGPKSDELQGGSCSDADGNVDLDVVEGSYKILVYVTAAVDQRKQYVGTVKEGKLSIIGLTPIGTSSRFTVTVVKAPPTPKASASAKPSPTSSPTTTPNAVPTPNKPTPSSSAFAVPGIAVVAKAASTINLTVQKPQNSLKIKQNTVVKVSLGIVSKGARVQIFVTGSGVANQPLKSLTTKSKAPLSAPLIKFTKSGTYSLKFVIGKIIRILTVTVTK